MKKTNRDIINYDLEAEKVLKLYKNEWNFSSMDCIFKENTKGGIIYVGNEDSAKDYEKLKSNNVTHIVNCTDNIQFYHQKLFNYYRFDISHLVWNNFNKTSDIYETISPLFEFINSALENGTSVLVHCLAGAHRAGTTGILCSMHYANQDEKTATSYVKKCRSQVEPIGSLSNILKAYEKARDLFANK